MTRLLLLADGMLLSANWLQFLLGFAVVSVCARVLVC